MRIEQIELKNYRNYREADIRPCEGITIFLGDNAQGKTNILEAVYLCCTGRSHRTSHDRELIRSGEEAAGVHVRCQRADGGHDVEIRLSQSERRVVKVAGQPVSRSGELMGHVTGVLFSPEDLRMVKDGPQERRRFVDGAYCQLMPGYVGKLTDFQRVLVQRNALLRQMTEPGRDTPADREMLELWNHTMAAAGARVTVARSLYCEKLQPLAAEIYSGLSGGREQLKLLWQSPAYEAGMSPPEVAARWMELLRQAEKADRRAGFSTEGPHREDLDLTLDGASVRSFGSQGQQRSAVLALKMAEAALLQEVTEEPPVAFLDDVMSELDVSRQEYILNHIHGWQVFITGCEPSAALRMTAGKVFHIKQGVISQ